MEIKYFKLIKTIAEEGNLANSSTKLFLTQSALSHQLKELEFQLGFKVFYRSRNKWKLTEEGSELYRTANKVLDSIQKGFDNIKDIQTKSKGVIKVGAECYSFYQGFPGFIQQMGRLYPEINIDLILESTHQPIEKLLLKEIDFAIVTNRPLNDDLLSVKFFEDEIFAIIHKENVLNGKKYVDAQNFKEQHVIIHSYPLETVSVYNQLLKPNKVLPLKISAVPLTQIALEMIDSNLGVTCMPKWALKSFKLPDNLVFKPIGTEGLKRQHYLVIRKQDENKAHINSFILNFKECFCMGK